MTSQDNNKNTAGEQKLATYRQQIDAIDDKLIALLQERIGIVQQVGELKKETAPGQCPIRAGREADMVRRIMQKFESSAFPAAAAGAMWRIIIGASTSVESQLRLSVYAPDGNNDYYWLGREYFGPFTPATKQPHIKRVIGDIMDGKASVGIVPMPRTSDQDYWWTNLMEPSKENRPQVFACIPFIHPDSLSKDITPALAISCIAPEPTESDTTLIVMETDFNVSQNRLQTAFSGLKMEATWIQIANIIPSSRHHLIEVKGFITPEHEGMKSLLSSLGSSVVLNINYLGSYATPIMMSNVESKPTLHAAGNSKK